MICSGDAGIYGMAGLMYEIGAQYPDTELEVIPGVTAATAGAALLGAPLTHDFCVISLSDLLTSWKTIEERILAASRADFSICLYKYKSPDTVCGIVKNIGREGEEKFLLTLKDLKDAEADMFTTVFVGNSQTKTLSEAMVTPRGYKDV